MSTGSYWRNLAAPIIREVIARVGRDDERALRKALHDAYPFGERQLHPYKIWRDEIRRQLDGRQGRRPPAPAPDAPGQLSLLPSGEAEVVADHAAFAAWLAREMPPGTIIGDPHWWAPRIARRAASLLKLQAAPVPVLPEGAQVIEPTERTILVPAPVPVAVAVGDWQPIGTAPKDGTEILASDYDAIEIVSWKTYKAGSIWESRSGDVMFPAWWQPLADHPDLPLPSSSSTH